MNTRVKTVEIIGGGTVSHVRNHLALSAPAYGETAKQLELLCRDKFKNMRVYTHLTRMAGGSKHLETVEDVDNLVSKIIQDLDCKIIFMNAAIVDFDGSVTEWYAPAAINKMGGTNGIINLHRNVTTGKHGERLKSTGKYSINLTTKPKIIDKIRQKRKDIFLVGFKTTTGATEDQQYLAGLNLVKKSSCNLVLANDVVTRRNMIITPEEARYHVTTDRALALRELVDMVFYRSQLTFTKSTVIDGQPIPWDSELVFPTLRTVVNKCIELGAYKPFNGITAGHFACKIGPNEFLTSIRKTNFNDLAKIGLVRVVTDGDDSVMAYGAKPSVGGQSQRIVFSEHPEYDSIVHFHCPIREGSKVPVVSQREYECGSHQCGENTSRGLKKFGNLSAVYLDQHGPNIVFNHSIAPSEVLDFIVENFDLSDKTGGPVSEPLVAPKLEP